MIGAIFDLGWWLWWNLAVKFIAWWLLGIEVAQLGLRFTPAGIAITLLGIAFSALLGWMDLHTQGCA